MSRYRLVELDGDDPDEPGVGQYRMQRRWLGMWWTVYEWTHNDREAAKDMFRARVARAKLGWNPGATIVDEV